MKFLCSVFLLALLSACASAPRSVTLDPEAFRQAYTQRYQQVAADVTLVPSGDTGLLLTTAAGDEFSIYLDNAYKEYLLEPGQLDEVLNTYVTRTQKVVHEEVGKELSLKQVFAVVKDKSYVRDVNALLVEQGQAASKALYFEPLNDELVVVFVHDSENSVRFLGQDAIEELGVQTTELRQRAVDNLSRRIAGVQTRVSDGLFMFELDGFYEASLLLVDGLWNSPALEIEGELVVAVPARDLLLASGSKSGHIDFMRSTAKSIARQSGYAISGELFVRRNGQWEIFNGTDE